MNRSLLSALLGALANMLSGCVSYEYRASPEPVFGNPRIAWIVGEPTSATVGDIVLAEGAELRIGPAYQLTRPLSFSMPGSLGVPFQCSLQPCVLEPRCMVGDQVLFAAALGAAAEYNGKSVFAPEDELGIRVDRRTAAVELYCDNSWFNKTYPGIAAWKRPATIDEQSAFRLTSCERLFWLPRSAALRYSGSSAGEVRFVYIRYQGTTRDGELLELDSTEYRFDVPADGQGEIAVRGAVIDLLSISPTELRYIVRRGFSAPSERESEHAPSPRQRGTPEVAAGHSLRSAA